MKRFFAERWLSSCAGLVVVALLIAGTSRATLSPQRLQKLPASSRVWLAPTGSDASCKRGAQARPCATFDRAFKIAEPGDKVLVEPGRYPVTDTPAAATGIHGSKSKPVTFVCAGYGPVTFAAPVFAFYPGASGVIVRGGCFRFHIPTFGFGGYTARTRNVVLDGVHMDSFECLGCANVTIRNSEIGPINACAGQSDANVRSRCDPANPIEAYYATLPNGTQGLQAEPFVHNGAAGRAVGFSLIGDRIHGIQTKDSGVMHTGGLLVWNTDNLVLRGNTFDHDAIYDVEFNAGSNDTNLVVEDNVFQPPVYPLDGTPTDGQETPSGFREFTAGSPGATFTNWSIRFNRLTHGLSIDGQGGQNFDNVHVVGNVLGIASLCARGVDFSSNVFVGHNACGTNNLRVPGFPYIDYKRGDFRIKTKSRAACFLADVRAGRSKKSACRRR